MNRVCADSSRRPNMLSVLRVRNFVLLWIGQAISQIGDGLFYIAEVWLVLQLTGSALAMGTTVILTLIPRLAFQLIGGVSVDRYDRRMLMLISDVVRGIVVLVFAILVATNHVRMAHVYALSIAFGIVSAFFNPAQSAIIPNLVPSEGLVAANSLFSLARQFSKIIGPLLAGFMIAVPGVGIAGVSFLNAASFAAGAAGVLLLRLPAQTSDAPKSNSSLRKDLADGFRYLLQFPALVAILLLSIVLNFALAPLEVLLPVFAKNLLGQGPQGVGFLLSALSVGMMAGGLAVSSWAPRTRRGAVVFLLTALVGLLFIALGLIPVLAATLSLLVAFGFLIAVVNPILVAAVQEMIADEYRGRVFSILMFSMGLMPIAMGLGTALADVVGAGHVLAAGGVITMVVSLGGLMFREVRTIQ